MLEGILALLSAVREYLVPLFELFRDERVAIALAIALIVIATCSALWFWLRHMLPWLGALKQAQARIAGAAGTTAFCERFGEIDGLLSGNSRLAHGWSEFKETLIFPDDIARRPLILNTARPQTYFNVQAAIDAGLPLPAYLALPNLFVGLGLLFTFIGLVAALHFAAQGVTSPDVVKAQLSLQALLKAATFKFMTSIVGVGISIVMSAWLRRVVGKLRQRFEAFCAALEQRMQLVSAESLAFDQLREMQKQSLQLERFNTDFAVELAGVLDQKLNATLSASMAGAVRPVVSAVEGLADSLGTMNQDAIATMIAEFQRALKQTSGEEMRSLVKALGDVRQTLDHASKVLQAKGADFGSRLDEVARNLESRLGAAARVMTDALAAAATQLETLLRGLSEQLQNDARAMQAAIAETGAAFSKNALQMAADFASALATSLAVLPRFEETLNRLDGRFKEQMDAFDQSITRLHGLAGDLEQGSRQLRDAATPIAATAGQFATAAQRIETAGTALQQTQVGLRDLIEQIKETFKSNLEVWQDYRQRFEQVDQHLDGLVKALIDGTKEHREEIKRFVIEMDGQLAKAVGSFAAAVNELQDFAEEITPLLQQAGPELAQAPPMAAAQRPLPAQGADRPQHAAGAQGPMLPDQKQAILDLYARGYEAQEIADRMGLTRQQVAAIKAHQTMDTYNRISSNETPPDQNTPIPF